MLKICYFSILSAAIALSPGAFASHEDDANCPTLLTTVTAMRPVRIKFEGVSGKSVSGILRTKPEDSVLVDSVTLDESYYAFPITQLTRSDRELFSSLKITEIPGHLDRLVMMPDDPADWVVTSDHHVVASAGAASKIIAQAKRSAAPKSEKVSKPRAKRQTPSKAEENLNALLAQTGVLLPQVNLEPDTATAILDFYRRNKGSAALYGQVALRRYCWDVLFKLRSALGATEYTYWRDATGKIEFSKNDVSLVANNEPAALARLAVAWQFLRTALRDPELNAPTSRAHVKRLESLYRETVWGTGIKRTLDVADRTDVSAAPKLAFSDSARQQTLVLGLSDRELIDLVATWHGAVFEQPVTGVEKIQRYSILIRPETEAHPEQHFLVHLKGPIILHLTPLDWNQAQRFWSAVAASHGVKSKQIELDFPGEPDRQVLIPAGLVFEASERQKIEVAALLLEGRIWDEPDDGEVRVELPDGRWFTADFSAPQNGVRTLESFRELKLGR